MVVVSIVAVVIEAARVVVVTAMKVACGGLEAVAEEEMIEYHFV